MKATGIVRKIDELGRVVLPKEIRKVKGLGIGTPMEIFVEGESIILKKYVKTCVFCNAGAEKEFNEIAVCSECVNKIKNEF